MREVLLRDMHKIQKLEPKMLIRSDLLCCEIECLNFSHLNLGAGVR
jgi:hypothetical protein